MASVFQKYRPQVFPNRYEAVVRVHELHGGIPSDPRVVEAWLRTKFAEDSDDVLRELVVETMKERNLDADAAILEVAQSKHLTGFKRDPDRGLYIEGRQLKACLKESANIAWPSERWGPTKKGTKSYFAEHLFVEEERLYVFDEDGNHVTSPTDIFRSFVKTRFGSSFVLEEYVEDAYLKFHITTDCDFKPQQWGELWVRAETNGIGASRSQGFGQFEVISWEKVGGEVPRSDTAVLTVSVGKG